MSRLATASLRILAFASALALLVPFAPAQTFTVLHNFSNGADGDIPQTGTVDAGGNFYGTTYQGGTHQCGLVFKLMPRGTSWVLDPLYEFPDSTDACHPTAGLIFGPDGTLYGTSTFGGTNGVGTVYRLQPSPNRCSTTLCPWRESVLYSFAGGRSDGAEPSAGVTFDAAGNIFGPTTEGGSPCPQPGCGVIFKLTPTGGQWSESIIYQFGGGYYGGNPNSPLTPDPAGNFYGAEMAGGHYGSVYELSPNGSGWNYSTVYHFNDGVDGEYPLGTLFYQGDIYGTTLYGGPGNGGLVYRLSQTSGVWSLTMLEGFNYQGEQASSPSPMVVDAQGNMYGTAASGGQYGHGTVFKLTLSGESWTFTSLHDFNGTDGSDPISVVLDSQGNLYGTTWGGGTYGFGTAFKITQ